jgi:hypothetical protein
MSDTVLSTVLDGLLVGLKPMPVPPKNSDLSVSDGLLVGLKLAVCTGGYYFESELSNLNSRYAPCIYDSDSDDILR